MSTVSFFKTKRYSFTRTHTGELSFVSNDTTTPEPFAGDWHSRAYAEVIRFVKIPTGYRVQWIDTDGTITDSADAHKDGTITDPASVACVANFYDDAGVHVFYGAFESDLQ